MNIYSNENMEDLEKQIDILAKYLLSEFNGPIKDESAIEMAMRLLNEYKFRDGVVGTFPNGERIDQSI